MRLKYFIELSKPRICVMALLTASLGYFLGASPQWQWSYFLSFMVGTALVGAGCGALNQWMEREIDAQMNRTKNRPLPTGKVTPKEALLFGMMSSAMGLVMLGTLTNLLTCTLGALTLITYLALYTPWKRKSSYSTLIGAIPGALPPLMGWTAATASISVEGLLLFLILFIWQIPHFLAIGWIFKDDYGKVFCPILNVQDNNGFFTARQIVIYSVVLLWVTLLPWMIGMMDSPIYLLGSILLGFYFLYESVRLWIQRTPQQARRVFMASIVYLPLLCGLLVWGKNL